LPTIVVISFQVVITASAQVEIINAFATAKNAGRGTKVILYNTGIKKRPSFWQYLLTVIHNCIVFLPVFGESVALEDITIPFPSGKGRKNGDKTTTQRRK
jgi:hypothetical protein